ncbi:hypothetical protein L1887_30434 [Cichorium endivia]|nr:hypothetical protein L1887_30434 [Cichorium endivia]
MLYSSSVCACVFMPPGIERKRSLGQPLCGLSKEVCLALASHVVCDENPQTRKIKFQGAVVKWAVDHKLNSSFVTTVKLYQEVVDSMVDRLKTLSRKSDGQFLAVDLRLYMLEHKGCQENGGDTMVDRLKTLSQKSDGQFLAVDLRLYMLEHKVCRATAVEVEID